MAPEPNQTALQFPAHRVVCSLFFFSPEVWSNWLALTRAAMDGRLHEALESFNLRSLVSRPVGSCVLGTWQKDVNLSPASNSPNALGERLTELLAVRTEP